MNWRNIISMGLMLFLTAYICATAEVAQPSWFQRAKGRVSDAYERTKGFFRPLPQMTLENITNLKQLLLAFYLSYMGLEAMHYAMKEKAIQETSWLMMSSLLLMHNIMAAITYKVGVVPISLHKWILRILNSGKGYVIAHLFWKTSSLKKTAVARLFISMNSQSISISDINSRLPEKEQVMLKEVIEWVNKFLKSKNYNNIEQEYFKKVIPYDSSKNIQPYNK